MYVCRVPSLSFSLSLGAHQCGGNGNLLGGFPVIWFLGHCPLWLGPLKLGGGSVPTYTCAGRGGSPLITHISIIFSMFAWKGLVYLRE